MSNYDYSKLPANRALANHLGYTGFKGVIVGSIIKVTTMVSIAALHALGLSPSLATATAVIAGFISSAGSFLIVGGGILLGAAIGVELYNQYRKHQLNKVLVEGLRTAGVIVD